jgi:hypothetical protein
MRTTRLVVLLLIFVFPYCIIYLSGLSPRYGRTIAAAILVVFFTGGSFWFSLSPKSELISENAKLNRADLRKWKKPVERTLRGLGVIFGIFFTIYITVPFIADVADFFKGQQPLRITGVVVENSSIVGLSNLKQSVALHDDIGQQNVSYTLLYSFSILKVGKRYELIVLSRSMIVLDHKELTESLSPSVAR